VSKKPKTPDVAAVWHEVKGISNGLAALKVTVAVTGNDVKRLESERLMTNRFSSGLSDSLEKHAEQIRKHDAWLAGLQNAEIDAQGIGEQIGDLEVRVANLEPLHAAVSMLEAKVANRHAHRECGTVRSVVTVLVIVQAFTTIAFLSWVIGGGH
jgi:hypothetical protein